MRRSRAVGLDGPAQLGALIGRGRHSGCARRWSVLGSLASLSNLCKLLMAVADRFRYRCWLSLSLVSRCIDRANGYVCLQTINLVSPATQCDIDVPYCTTTQTYLFTILQTISTRVCPALSDDYEK